ncbi:endonuclease/exonuclease/phosphatase family protein [Anatilimnocola floriformis]|uniref:endonuclease/exonuclease/phosphatase family protein n=1 Tax=Anatilimnocola floriformis TaxID=2948575 RepID=UPI0020C2B5CA|nr:endonuclease/exonuclease/phosphatase family protein [Anatilimnocola floriformis]
MIRRAISFAVVGLALLGSAAFADPPPEQVVICSWNTEWMFDNYDGDNFSDLAKKMKAPSREDWDWKLAGVEKVVREIKPTILGLQEIENQRVLFYLNQRFKDEAAYKYRIAFIEGTDYFTEQDVGLMALSGLIGFGRREMSKEEFEDKRNMALTKHIFGTFEWGTGADKERVTVCNMHLRARGDATNLRVRQAHLARVWVNELIKKGENVILMGDMNTDEFATETKPDGDIGTMIGLDTPEKDDDLFDTLVELKDPKRHTHLNGQQYDRILLSRSLVEDDPNRKDLSFKSVAIRRDLVIRKEQDKDHMDIFWSIPAEERDTSDHYPLVVTLDYK